MCCLLFFSPKSKDSHWYALLIHPISAGNPVDPEGTPPANLGHKSQVRQAIPQCRRPSRQATRESARAVIAIAPPWRLRWRRSRRIGGGRRLAARARAR